ncbi:HAD-IA family hydrolase [Sagittula sp. NFXS13]|uniref:HAD family hydrolase n=1 Tax=Sagittula sp. NFXS13 TaxID=2819095 RepID=UPI0032E00672
MTDCALLFDLDGTMLDTDTIHQGVFADMLAPTGLTVTEDFYLENIHGRLNADIFAELMPDAGDPQQLSEDKEAEFRKRLPKPYPGMPGVSRLVERAMVEGWGLAVVTNAPRVNAEAMLNAIGLREAFEVVIIGEECERGKPDPLPYQMAMRQLGIAPDRCIAFEDSPSGMRAAAASGALAVGIRSSLDDSALRANGAIETLKDFNDKALEPLLQRIKGETVI